MDSQIISNLLAFISFFLFMITALRIGKNLIRKKSDAATLNIPPGPWKLPIIGNIHNLNTSTPHRKLRDLANIYGPLMHLQLGEVFAIVVSTPEYAKEVMKTHDLIFASRPKIQASEILSYNSTNIVYAPYGNYWRQLRKICTLELLSPKRVNSFKPVREEELTNLIQRIENSGKGYAAINLTEEVLSSIYTITSRAAFGRRFKDQDKFISFVKETTMLASGFDIGDLFPSSKWLQLVSGSRSKLERLKRQSDEVLENIIKVHKEAKKSETKGESVEDLVDVLLRFEDGNASDQEICLTKDNIKAIILDIFAGGGETAATTIGWAMAELIKNPRIIKKAQVEVRDLFDKEGRVDENCINELKYLKSVVKETLRLHPPIPLLIPRECAQACEIKGYHIPVKSKVIVNAWAITRDPNYWSEPERFYPERFIGSSIDYKGSNFEFIPFGAGRRICPGRTLGLINTELTLAFLLYHFDWELPNGVKCDDFDMTEQFGLTVRRKDDLYLIPITSRPLLVIGK